MLNQLGAGPINTGTSVSLLWSRARSMPLQDSKSRKKVVRDITGVTGARDRGKRSEGVWGALRRRQEREDCHVRG